MPQDPFSKYGGKQQTDATNPFAKYGGTVVQDQQAQAPIDFPRGEISATHPTTSIGGKLEEFGQNFANDLRYGGESTFLGKLLKKAGAQPTTAGTSPATGEFMASLPLGVSKMVQGQGQALQGKVLQGLKTNAQGALQAATIPASFASPLEGEAAAKGAMNLVGSKSQGSELFGQVMSKAQNVPLDVTPVVPAITRAQELANAGNTMPPVMAKFMARMSDPAGGPITYKEARDFYSTASRLSAEDLSRMSGPMKAQLAEFVHSLGGSIVQGTAKVGQDANYTNAMQLYRRAAQTSSVAKYMGKAALGGAAGAAGAYGAYKIGSGVIDATR